MIKLMQKKGEFVLHPKFSMLMILSRNLRMNATIAITTISGAIATTKSMNDGIRSMTAVSSSWIGVKLIAADAAPMRLITDATAITRRYLNMVPAGTFVATASSAIDACGTCPI